MNKKVVSLLTVTSLLLVILMGRLSIGSVKAYVLMGHTVPNHNYVTYHGYSSFSAYINNFNTYAVKRNISPKITIVPSLGTSAAIQVQGDLMTSTGNYAVPYIQSDGTSSICFFHSFVGFPAVEKHETIIYEVGHSLGLAHCQPSQENVSVMREKYFNHVETPLLDDWAGINALY